MISVILMTYNQDISSILLSIESVLRQDGCEFEIVIADDGSIENQEAELKAYFCYRSFTSFTFIRSPQNKGIVSNLLSGVQAASYPLIKPLSPGDLLYRPDTLSSIQAFCDETGAEIGFGKLSGYSSEGARTRMFSYDAPTNPEAYNDLTIDCESLAMGQLIKTDWVPGCSLFYGRDFILRYLLKLKEEYGVIYSEDLTCPLITLDKVRIRFLDLPILWYEIGAGISTAGNKASRTRLYRDHRSFYTKLLEQNPNSPLCRSAMKHFRVREFIALRTPFYNIAQSIVRHRYTKGKGSLACSDQAALTFFDSCRAESARFGREYRDGEKNSGSNNVRSR